MRPPPSVTGISPAEGPPGTKVIIRGENLGVNVKDVIGLTICGANCLPSADYKSASKIVARTGKAKPGKGDVIVTTKSGGEGSCTVQFKLQTVIPDPLRESAVWIEEVDLEELRATSGSARPVSPQLLTSHDPLGIASDIFGYGSFPEERLEELYPEGTGNILAENFHPAWFLLEKHSETNFETLKNGLHYLKHEESRRATGPLAFVKDNIATFLDALDTLRDLQKKMLKDESTCEGGSIAEKLESILQGASKNADALFQDVLSRKDDADRTRNALNVLQRFRFLFSLPQSIERNIQQGDFEMVISDYARAKSLFSETDIKTFKKVLQEVETKIEGFRLHLKNKLHELPTPPEEQKKFIRYLVELDTSGDPAWECISNQHEWIIKLMTSCNEDHVSKDAAPLLHVESLTNDLEIRTRIHSSLTSGSHRDDTHSRSYPGLFSPPPVRSLSLDRQGKGTHTSPQRVLFVEELSEILTETLPDLWHLGQDYFSGAIMKEDTSSPQKHQKPMAGKQSQFEDMVKAITNLYSTFLRAGFFPSSSHNLTNENKKTTGTWQSTLEGLGAWLPLCVRSIKTCLDSLIPLSLPSDCLQSVQELMSDMKSLCMAELFKEAVDEITSLHCNELWSLEKDEQGGRITSLPLLFENSVMETVHVLKEISSDSDSDEKESEMKKKVVEYFKEMVQAFKECLHHLAFQPDQDSDKASISSENIEAVTSHTSLPYSNSLSCTTDDVPFIDERLLVVLNNCRFVRERVLPRLVENFRKRDYPISDAVKEELHSELSKLESKIFDAYIDQKGEPLTQTLEPGMYAGGFKWHDCLPPQDIRSYIKEVIMNLVMVHSQVFLVSAQLLPLVLSRLTDILAKEFKRLFQSTSKGFTSAGTVTAHLETRALQETLAAYMTSQSRQAFQEAMEMAPQPSKDSDKRLIETLMAKFKRRMKFQLECFRVDMEEI